MPRQVYDLNPVERIVVGAIGEPGDRVFYLQARKGRRLVTVVCEKEQVQALSLAIDQVLLALVDDDPDALAAPEPSLEDEMELELPLQPVFRSGELRLGYDQVSERLVVMAYEQVEEEQEGQRSVARFWATPAQMRALSMHGQKVVAAGRPRGPMCGEPIGPEGHFCPRKNGDRKT